MRRRFRGSAAAIAPCLALVAALASCAGAPGTRGADDSIFDEVPADHPLVGYRAQFLLTYEGARVGDAVESLERRRGQATGFRFTRRELISVRRGTEPVKLETTLVIDTDDRLEAQAVTIEQRSGGAVVRGAATRGDGGWELVWADETPSTAPAEAVPAALAPLLAATAGGRFEGPVLLEGYGFATAHLVVEPSGQARARLAFTTPYGTARGEATLRENGTLEQISVGAAGARRASAEELARRFPVLELVDRSALWVTGGRSAQPRGPRALRITGATRPAPPPLPGQRLRADGDGWHLELDPDERPVARDARPAPPPEPEFELLANDIVAKAGARGALQEAAALARAVDALLVEDLAEPVTSASAALARRRGDCTAHALLFAELAAARGIPTRLVTGYRLDDARLIRHRWVAAAIDGRWIAIDPTHGEAPASPRLIGLASHGSSARELTLADEFTFAGMTQAAAYLD